MLTTPDPTSGEQDHVLPALSPDGRVVFFTVTSEIGVDTAQIVALDLKTGQRRTVIRGGSDATYIEASRVVRNGLLVYASAGTLNAVRFDLEGLALSSDPVPVVEQVVMTQTGATQYALSPQGTLVYVSGPSAHLVPRSLEWITRDGRRDAVDAPPGPYATARLSPDGTRVALAMADQWNDIWIYYLARRTMTNLTANPSVDLNPIWSPDGERIVFASNRSGSLQLHSQRADGTGPVVPLTTGAATSAGRIPNSFSPDGRALVFREFAGDAIDLMLLRLDPGPRVEPLLQTPAVEMNGEVSPDGRWMAYESSGQVFVRPFPNVEGARYQISIEAGSKPAWSGRGDELFYLDPKTTAIMAVPVQTTGRFDAGAAVKLFVGPWYAAPSGRVYDVSRDGQRFLMIRATATTGSSTAAPVNLTVVVNWTEELRARLSPAR
jgi:serine/threonine-protein kinase